MAIVNVRIDERLVHGQVANIWTPMLKLDRIVVVDNDIVKNDIEKMSIKLATPAGVKLSVITVEKAIQNFKTDKYGTQRVLLLVRKVKSMLELVEAGIGIEKVNLANLGNREGCTKIMNSVYVNEEEKSQIKKMMHLVDVYSQMVPNHSVTRIEDVL